MNDKPCLNCPDRHRACHDSCERYAAVYRRSPEEKQQERARVEMSEYIGEAIRRMKNNRRSRNGKYRRNGR